VLMVIAFIPFPTSVLSESGNRTATIFYALVMSLGGLLVMLLWWHAVHHHNLVDPHLDRQRMWKEIAAPLVTVVIFLLSIGVAFWNEGLVRLFWVLIFPVSFISNARINAGRKQPRPR